MLSLVAAAVLLVTGTPLPAPAAPAATTTPTDPEGGTPSLRQALENASKGYTDAKLRLANSIKRQAALGKQQTITQAKVELLSKDVQVLAATAYRGGQVNLLNAALDSGSIPTLLDKSEIIDQLSWQNNHKISELKRARADLEKQKIKIAGEIKIQQAQEVAMSKRKTDAERALAAVGGGASGGFSGSSTAAKPAPRNSDGSWPGEGCSLDDPTSGGCVSPRMRHAYDEARLAGFSRYTHCFREASFGEHPKGKACDFSASKTGFGSTATGGEKSYGNNLAAWCINNADRLGVLYVIWFRQIWMPSTGWRAYNGGSDPSSAHTNHVHLSVQ
jgi:hypothetical protein